MPNIFCQSEPIAPQASSYIFNKNYVRSNYHFEILTSWNNTIKCNKIIIFVLQLIVEKKICLVQ